MLGVFIFISLVVTNQANKESYVVEGSPASIKKYPHSAFLGVNCHTENEVRLHWTCGSSIVNQKILLTAGHCVDSCISSETRITINMGNENRAQGVIRSASGFILHEKYDHDFNSDIALVRMRKPVKFTDTVRRVAIMPNPPYREPANIAGWGNIDRKGTQVYFLMEIDQKIWRHKSCERLFSHMPKGTICASSKKVKSFPAPGDSGSALVVRDYIQVGLVSFKVPPTAENVIFYTDIGYYYEWIKYNSRRLYCR